jgi:mono/diheme cytochrome c family protein/plastocyanin
MNTRKQVLIMSALLMSMLIIIGIYGAWYPSRETDAEEHFEEATAERGAILFARNCRLCHGDVGEGGSLGSRLPAAPALDRPDLQGFTEVSIEGTPPTPDTPVVVTDAITAGATDIKITPGSSVKAGSLIMIDDERMEVSAVDGGTLTVKRAAGNTTAAAHNKDAAILLFDKATLDSMVKLITNTITCGRVGTAMPAWGASQNGPLSDEQIRQLMTVITQDYWHLVKEEDDVEDFRTVLTESADGNANTIEVKDVTVLNVKDAIRIGDERLRVTSVTRLGDGGDKRGVVTVDRGILKTTPLDHAEGDNVYIFPETSEPSINQASCGQTAKPAQPTGPIGEDNSYTGNVTIEETIQGVAFQSKTITAPANTSIRIRLHNQDDGTDHNIAFYPSSTSTTAPLAPGSIGQIFPGVNTDDTVFTTPGPGSYFFRCDVHPTTMTGTFNVTP